MCRHSDWNDQLDRYHHRVRDVPSVWYVKKQSMKDDAKRRSCCWVSTCCMRWEEVVELNETQTHHLRHPVAKDKVYYLSETLNEEMEEMENFFPSSSSFCSFLSTLFSQLVAFPTLSLLLIERLPPPPDLIAAISHSSLIIAVYHGVEKWKQQQASSRKQTVNKLLIHELDCVHHWGPRSTHFKWLECAVRQRT